MNQIRYYARSASDRTDDWPYWFVADRKRGDVNVTAELVRRIADPNHKGAVFAPKEICFALAETANELLADD